ncbi:MAG: WYL domain-containing protein [SAR202 cluster bacterium]|nr:WYL domain-containing protein [SAR202 cluster bacterium]HJO58218.1 WYL domain-containing protein [Nitrospinaceae bacterium]
MRYEKFEDLLHLALEMQANRGGISLEDIQERFSVSRRTAMRMRDSVMRVFPQADEMMTGERKKRWRIPTGVVDRLISFSADELANLETAVRILKRENMKEAAVNLQDFSTKLMALMDSNIARRVEPDLEALLLAEGLAMRPGPKPRISSLVLEDLRYAIKGCEKVQIRHRNRVTNRLRGRLVWPYGFLYGNRHYLLAFDEETKEFRKFTLPNIEEVNSLGEYFERDPDFSLEEYAEESFGVYNEDPFDVVWRFAEHVARDVRQYAFHPNQEMTEDADGSVTVKFRAGGSLEMAWHLYQWGEHVEVLEPKQLADMVHPNRMPWPGNP